jgi:hypothetical protein
VERAFDLNRAEFWEVPNFSQADFKQAPDFADVRFPLPGFWFGGCWALIPQYRALRRMAIQGADYEREQMAYKGELRARRWTVDKPWHLGLWLGLFTTARGLRRSMSSRFLATSVPVFAVLYLRRRSRRRLWLRRALPQGVSYHRNALVLFSGRATRGSHYQCLYGGNGEPPPDSVSFIGLRTGAAERGADLPLLSRSRMV